MRVVFSEVCDHLQPLAQEAKQEEKLSYLNPGCAAGGWLAVGGLSRPVGGES